MDTSDFYEQILGITSPWYIKEVLFSAGADKVNVYLSHNEQTQFSCAECGKACSVYDHSPERSWRHLDTCQLETILYAKLPRINCKEHGITQAKCDWADNNSRFTLLMEKFVLTLLNEVETVSSIAKICRVGWHSVFGILSRHIKKRQGELSKTDDYPVRIGIDEKAILKGHKYMTIIYDLDTSKVVAIIEDRKKEPLIEYFKSVSMKNRRNIKSICMDMWPAFYSATIATIPGAKSKIVHDKFHIISYLNKAVDKVRSKENTELKSENKIDLKGTKFHWMYNPENMPEKIREDFDILKKTKLKTSKAWYLKELFRPLFNYSCYAEAKLYFKSWYKKVKESGLKEMIDVADMLKRHEYNILTYAEHKTSNGKAEGLNARIMTIKRKARGHRNFDNLKSLIYFYLGKYKVHP